MGELQTYIHTFIQSIKKKKNKGEYMKNALKREFKRLALCKKLQTEKSLKYSINIKNLMLKIYIQRIVKNKTSKE